MINKENRDIIKLIIVSVFIILVYLYTRSNAIKVEGGIRFLISFVLFLLVFKWIGQNNKKTLILIDGLELYNAKLFDIKAYRNLKFELNKGIYFKSQINGKNIDVILYTDKLTRNSEYYTQDQFDFKDFYSMFGEDNITAIELRSFKPEMKEFWNQILVSYEKGLEISLEKRILENREIWSHNNKELLNINYDSKSKLLVEFIIFPIVLSKTK